MTYFYSIASLKNVFEIWGAGVTDDEAKENATRNLNDQKPNAQVSVKNFDAWGATKSLYDHVLDCNCPCLKKHWVVEKDENGDDYAYLKIDEGGDDPDG